MIETPKPAISQDQRERVNAALEACGGNKELAAVQLQIKRGSLDKILRGDQVLYRRWVTPRAKNPDRIPDAKDRIPREMTDSETFDRPAKPAPNIEGMSASERKQWEMISVESDMRNALMRMKLSPNEAELAEHLAEFHQENLVGSMHIIGGGVTRMSIVLQTQVDATAKRLEFIRGELQKTDLPLADRVIYANEEKVSGQLFIAASSELRQIFDTATRGLSLMAAIRDRLKNPKPGNNGKPGFQASGTIEPVGDEAS